MSLDRNLTPEDHLATGAMLAPLRDEGVLIVASGNIIHNLSLWRESAGTQPEWAIDFRERTNAAILANDTERLALFAEDDRPAQLAVNSGEHYIPLLYAMGAWQPGDAARLFNDTLDGSLSMTSALIGDTALLDGIE
jgi:4,5-DOPA dioxygenase extradiol